MLIHLTIFFYIIDAYCLLVFFNYNAVILMHHILSLHLDADSNISILAICTEINLGPTLEIKCTAGPVVL